MLFFLFCFMLFLKVQKIQILPLSFNYSSISEIFLQFRRQWSLDSTDRSLLHTDTERLFCSKQRTSEISYIAILAYVQDHYTWIGIKNPMSSLAPIVLQLLLTIYPCQNCCVELEHKITCLWDFCKSAPDWYVCLYP